jgi:ASC-1-like (ASCH) protein
MKISFIGAFSKILNLSGAFFRVPARVHELKIDANPYAFIKNGAKTVDLRQDRPEFDKYRRGDLLVFKDEKTIEPLRCELSGYTTFDQSKPPSKNLAINVLCPM